MRYSMLVLTGAVSLASCAPQITGSNERGGMLHMGLGPAKRAKAFKLAEAECAKHDRVARVTGHSEWDNSFTYDCVDK
jgi:hypothetical protein